MNGLETNPMSGAYGQLTISDSLLRSGKKRADLAKNWLTIADVRVDPELMVGRRAKIEESCRECRLR